MDQYQIPTQENVSSPATPVNPSSCSHHHEFQKYRELLDNASALIVQVRDALAKSEQAEPTHASPLPPEVNAGMPEQSSDRIVEGVFNGYAMLGDDTKQYPVPPNYASKSKLVDGDRLKLIIRGNGQFVYKQIGPVERERRVGVLEPDAADGGFAVVSAGRSYHVLGASITYYHGQPGDEVVLLVPRGGMSPWAAVENIIKPSIASISSSPTTPPIAANTPLDPIDPLNNDISSLLPSF
ncbi:hypothetical protein HZA86_01485 [Candidatus Uhrbacteria bacterium]|nr:hypothetical protein [Candidatus Uhrbacteria bacterium]